VYLERRILVTFEVDVSLEVFLVLNCFELLCVTSSGDVLARCVELASRCNVGTVVIPRVFTFSFSRTIV